MHLLRSQLYPQPRVTNSSWFAGDRSGFGIESLMYQETPPFQHTGAVGHPSPAPAIGPHWKGPQILDAYMAMAFN